MKYILAVALCFTGCASLSAKPAPTCLATIEKAAIDDAVKRISIVLDGLATEQAVSDAIKQIATDVGPDVMVCAFQYLTSK